MSVFPDIHPNETFRIKVDHLHELYVEESGNPGGIPVVFLHGGPGAGTEHYHRRLFNPEKYRIILFDQRGCGQSTPHAELEGNTTQALVDDIEIIRQYLSIEQWVV
ncbi:MAG: alpha/beta fold hydrolase, partial [Gammaproteobacteria bacterium]|nr:alpha/beta fold hydrolase [Gammaproteobacteria bacterium]